MRTGTIFCAPVLIEALEGRMMLSAAPAAHHPHSHHHAGHAVHKPSHHKTSAGAVDPIFMQINGLSGDVSLPGFVGDIQLNSFQFGVGRGIGSPIGGADRESSAPSVSEIVVTKALDKTSTALLRDILVGTDIPEIDIFFVNVSKSGQTGTAYAEYVLSDVLLSGYSASSGGDRPSESISLNFTKIQYRSFTQNADGTTSVDSVSYDLIQGKVL
jgi:type VI secretion system secreted protein Hcp